MKIVIVGTGYVGLVTGACFAELGNDVACVDVDESKLLKLAQGVVPIHEPGLQEMVLRNVGTGRMSFHSSLREALDRATAVFIAVGTPPNEDGSADLSQVLSVASEIGDSITSRIVVVNKSTVPIGSAEKVNERIRDALKRREVDIDFSVVSNPEFLKEGAAIKDFLSPDRIVIGTSDPVARTVMSELYAPFARKKDKIQFMGLRDAEMTKYAANAMLATKISFMNEIALMCEAFDVDVEQVRKGIGSDSRIGFSFIYPGVGYGGSCFPKDVRALIAMGSSKEIEAHIMAAVNRRNDLQKELMFEKLRNNLEGELRGKVVAVWGLSFKPETDDVREAPALTLIQRLLNEGLTVRAYDPEAVDSFRESLGSGNIDYFSDMYEALNDVDALVVMTEWKEFRQPDFERMMELMRTGMILDGRNIYDPAVVKTKGFSYEGIGRR